jgi:integrase
MPRIKLTEKVIARLKGRAATDKSKEPIIWFDESLPGFGVSVSSKKAGSKTYVVQRDLPDGRTVRRKIGRVSDNFPLERARREADELIRQLDKGIDQKTIRKGAMSLAQAAETYLAARPNFSENSVRDYRRVFDRYLKDWLDMKLGEITSDMVESRHLELGKDPGAATANGVMRTLRAIFNHAIEKKYQDVTSNPVKLRRQQWYDVPRRSRHVKADELPKFFAAVKSLDNAVARDYISLVLFTGLRREEAASLTWRDIDFTAQVIRIPAERTKPGRRLDLPMTDFVLKLLKARRELGDANYVFPANSGRGHIAEPKFPLGLVAQATTCVGLGRMLRSPAAFTVCTSRR